MSVTLADTLTGPQNTLLKTGTVKLTIDLGNLRAGLFLARDTTHIAAGRSPRLAIEALLARTEQIESD